MRGKSHTRRRKEIPPLIIPKNKTPSSLPFTLKRNTPSHHTSFTHSPKEPLNNTLSKYYSRNPTPIKRRNQHPSQKMNKSVPKDVQAARSNQTSMLYTKKILTEAAQVYSSPKTKQERYFKLNVEKKTKHKEEKLKNSFFLKKTKKSKKLGNKIYSPSIGSVKLSAKNSAN